MNSYKNVNTSRTQRRILRQKILRKMDQKLISLGKMAVAAQAPHRYFVRFITSIEKCHMKAYALDYSN